MISMYFISFILLSNSILYLNAYQSSSPTSSVSSLQLINSDGICKGENQINAFIQTNPFTSSSKDSEIKLCSILDCTGDNDINTINQVFNINLVHSNGKG